MVRNSPIEESALVCATMPGSDIAAHTPVPPTTHVHTMHTAAGTNTTPPTNSRSVRPREMVDTKPAVNVANAKHQQKMKNDQNACQESPYEAMPAPRFTASVNPLISMNWSMNTLSDSGSTPRMYSVGPKMNTAATNTMDMTPFAFEIFLLPLTTPNHTDIVAMEPNRMTNATCRACPVWMLKIC